MCNRSAIFDLNEELKRKRKEEEAADLASDLGDSEKGYKISQKLKYIIYLENIWNQAVSKYEQIKRKETEDAASESFVKMTNNAAGFSGVELAEGFGLKLIDAENEEHPGSPGAWSVVAFSMIHALAKCSNISFPLVIDTPLRSIGLRHFKKVSEHFFEDERTVILLPNYLVGMDEADNRLNHLLTAGWTQNWMTVMMRNTTIQGL